MVRQLPDDVFPDHFASRATLDGLCLVHPNVLLESLNFSLLFGLDITSSPWWDRYVTNAGGDVSGPAFSSRPEVASLTDETIVG